MGNIRAKPPFRFDQRHGRAPLPTQLRRDEVSNELKAKIWSLLHRSMPAVAGYPRAKLGGDWHNILYDWHVRVLHQPSDEFDDDYERKVRYVRSIIYDTDYVILFTFLEHFIQSGHYHRVKAELEATLEECKAAWRIVGDEIVPFTSEEEAAAVGAALSEVKGTAPPGAKVHLAKASGLLASGDWGGSVRESIHAVESVARIIEPSGTLGEALKAIGKSGRPLHPALNQAFLKLYGYTSDAKGIRHALTDADAAEVGEAEAVFMYAACVSFCQYLLRLVPSPSE